MKLKVSEIFYSLQGEGGRVGTPTIFIRLQGCKAKFACAKLGIKCDTEFESGREMTLQEILEAVKELDSDCREITWTGGEPTDQLTRDVVRYFKACGYYQAIETSGLNPVPDEMDYVCISPKVAEHVIAKNFPKGVQELRYVRHKGQSIPQPAVQAERYYISPHASGNEWDADNIKHCINLCLQNPQWKLSLQTHKLLNIL